ncbi:MAG TPA: hypothetical protein VGF24_25265 [Vicinamibacterales bacterium]
MLARLLLTLAAVAWTLGSLSAQTDLDAFMSRVLERRDDNWKKLQQYVLEERETLQITGPGARPLYGTQRDYAWFPRDGIFIKSPLRADGVIISENERRKAEEEWLQREQRREKRRAERAARSNTSSATDSPAPDAGDTNAGAISEASVREAIEPGFVSAAYFLKFKFDPGQYALAGRETLEGRNVLRIEYYPTKLFNEGRKRANKEIRKRDDQIDAKMDKVALVTLWVDPAEHQILKYDFHNLPLDFLPGRSIVRIDGLRAAMEMGQPFPDVWLPRAIRVGFDMSLAIGEVDGRYAADFHDYKLATVSTRVR